MKSRHHLLRSFVLLLLTVFVINTVYASGMMTVIPEVKPSHANVQVSETHQAMHCHDDNVSNKATLNQHAPHKSHSACKTCNHCFACFSAIPQSALSTFATRPHLVLASAFAPIYLSPTHIQPQKPPIA